MKGHLTRQIRFQFAPEDHDTLKALAKEAEVTEGQLIRYILRKFISEKTPRTEG